MLRRVRVRVDPLRDHAPQAGLVREPLAGEPADGVPADAQLARSAIRDGPVERDDVRAGAEAYRLLQLLLRVVESLLPVMSVSWIPNESSAVSILTPQFRG